MNTPVILLGIAVILQSINSIINNRKMNDVMELLGIQHEINEEQNKVNQQVKAALEHILKNGCVRLQKEGANVPK